MLTDTSSNYLDIHDEPEDGLKIWGYMPGHVHFNLGWTNSHVSIARSGDILVSQRTAIPEEGTVGRFRQVRCREQCPAYNTS